MNTIQKELTLILNAEFARSKLKNPAYSLRAFARRLNIPVSALSGILKGKHPISKKNGKKIIDALAIDPRRAVTILENLKYRRNRKELVQNTQALEMEIEIDHTHMIVDWYNAAVFSLAQTRGFEDSPSSVSQRLGITLREAKSSLARLERLGILVRNNNDRLIHIGKAYTVPNLPEPYFIRHHRENLELALRAIDEDDLKGSSFSGIMMAIDPSKIPEAKQRISAFRKELCQFLEGGSRKKVYRMNIQLFPLSDRQFKKS